MDNINNNEYKKIVALSKNKEFLINKDNKITTNSIKNDNKQKTPTAKFTKEKKNKKRKFKNFIIQPSKSKSDTFELFEKCRPLRLIKKRESFINIKNNENETK